MTTSFNHSHRTKLSVLEESSPSLKVLVAEDNLSTQKTIVQLLICLHHQAQGVSNGLEVLEALRKQTYDVILMDVQMPHMTGLEAAQQIRQEFPRERQPHIIAMTGRTLSEEQQECLDAGMDQCLTKPIRMETLTNTLKQLAPLQSLTETTLNSCSDNSNSVLDAEVLAEIRTLAGENANAFLVSVIDEYLQEAPGLLQSIQEAIAHQQVAQVIAAAQSLRAMSGFLGALQFSQLCEKLVNIGKLDFISGSQNLLPGLEAEYSRVEHALTLMRQEALV